MSRYVLLALIAALALAGCLPQPSTPVNVDDLVATTVSSTLTAQAPPPTVPPTQPQVTVDTPVATFPPTATEPPTLIPSTGTTTPTATSPATTTPTPIAGDPRTTLGGPTWRDPLDSGNGWNLGEDSYTVASVEAGELVLTGRSTLDGWRITGQEVRDAYLEATIEADDCTGSDHYGLMFRVPDFHNPNEGYLLGFTCDGRYWLRSWDGVQMETLVPLTASAAINAGSGKTNRAGVMTDGDRLALYANGTLLQEIVDDSWSDKGGFGVFIGARKTEGFTTRMDEIAYWDLP